MKSRLNFLIVSSKYVYLSNFIITRQAIEQLIMDKKFCTNTFCLNNVSE